MWRVLLSLGLVVAMVAGASAAVDLSAGLELYLPLDGSLADASGNSRDGVLTDGTNGTNAFIAGQVIAGVEGLGAGNQALDFGSVLPVAALESIKTEKDFVELPWTPTLTGSISMWYKTSPERYNYEAIWDNAAHKDRWESWTDRNLETGMGGPDDGPRTFIRTSENSFNADPALRDHQLLQIHALEVDTWYHIVGTWEQVNGGTECSATMWINGWLVDSAVDIPWELNPGNFFLAGGNVDNNQSIGAYDEVRLYSRILNDDEIRTLAGIPEPSTVVLLLAGALTALACFRKR